MKKSKKGPRRHVSPRHVRLDIAEISKKTDNWHGMLAVLYSYGLIVAILASFSNLLNLYKAQPIKLTAVYSTHALLLGVMFRSLATIVHESGHRTFIRNRNLNACIGFVCAWPIFHSLTGYKWSHSLHHKHTHEPCKDEKISSCDPDYDFLRRAKGGYEGPRNRLGRFIKFLIVPFLPGYAKLVELVKNRLLPKGESTRERLTRMVFTMAFVLLFASLPATQDMLVLWLLATIWAFPAISEIIERLEHYPFADSKSTLYETRNRHIAPILKLFIGIHCESYHLIHHLYPGVPFYRLKEVHILLMTHDDEYALATIRHGGIGLFWNTIGVPSILQTILQVPQQTIEIENKSQSNLITKEHNHNDHKATTVTGRN